MKEKGDNFFAKLITNTVANHYHSYNMYFNTSGGRLPSLAGPPCHRDIACSCNVFLSGACVQASMPPQQETENLFTGAPHMALVIEANCLTGP